MLLLRRHVLALLSAIAQLACCQHQIQPLSRDILASTVQSNHVYILGNSRTGVAAITTALQTLGYKKILPGDLPMDSADHSPNQATFSVISVELGVEEHSTMSPGAKYILPVEDDNFLRIEYPNGEGFGEQGFGSEYQNYRRSVYDYFTQSDHEANLLEFQVTQNSDRVGDDWPKLCQFLGLGYSVVERHHLRQFP